MIHQLHAAIKKVHRTTIVALLVAAIGVILTVSFDNNSSGNILLLVSAAVSWAFTLRYVTKSRWRYLNAGKSLLYVFICLSVVLTQNALSIYFGQDYTGRALIRNEMYLGLAVAVFGMFATLIKIQGRDKKEVNTLQKEREFMDRFLDEEQEKLEKLEREDENH